VCGYIKEFVFRL